MRNSGYCSASSRTSCLDSIPSSQRFTTWTVRDRMQLPLPPRPSQHSITPVSPILANLAVGYYCKEMGAATTEAASVVAMCENALNLSEV